MVLSENSTVTKDMESSWNFVWWNEVLYKKITFKIKFKLQNQKFY